MKYMRFHLLLFLFIGFTSASFAEAATLSVYPAINGHHVGDIFSVNIIVTDLQQAMNAASGVITFPVSQLEVVSLSKEGLLLSLWVKEPVFSNVNGTVSFEGVVPNPGFSGVTGKLLTVTFKAKTVGFGDIKFASGSVLANDGRGTNMLTGFGNAKISLTNPPTPTTVPPAATKPRVPTSSSTKSITSQKAQDAFDAFYGSTTEKHEGKVAKASAQEPQSDFNTFAQQVIGVLSKLIIIIALIFGLLFIVSHGWHLLLRHHRGLRKKVCDMDSES